MDFSGYIGAITAINMINSHCSSERHEDVSVELIEEDRTKEVVHNLGVHGIFRYTRGNFIVPSGK